jgi:hypothetical protein
MQDRREDTCGCGGPGTPVNKPLYELSRLIAMLERQEQARERLVAKRIIAEIEKYLSFPMRDVKCFWENEERRSLSEVLTLLKTAA